jgi:uncharacterized membrane protein (DUF106 family)
MFNQAPKDFMYIITTPPGSMIFILVLSFIVALISTGLTKLLVDTDEINRKQKLIKGHQEQKAKVVELADIDVDKYRKARKRWERKEVMLKQTQQRMALQRLKPTCVFCIPMMVMFGIIRVWYENNPIALTPMNAVGGTTATDFGIPILGDMVAAFTVGIEDWTALFYGKTVQISRSAGWINFTAWYFICSLGINTLMQRILGIQTQASGGMEEMFGGQKAKSIVFPDV